MTYGEKIADLRKKRGMTQDELGKAMNVSYQAVSKWERGESTPDFETMSKIAKLFNVPIGYFEENAESTPEEAPAETEKSETAPEKSGPEAVKEAEPEKEVVAPPPVETVIGVCTVCGKMLKEGEAATTSPKILCKPCAERKRRAAQQEAERQRQKLRAIKLREVSEIVGHGADATLIISLVRAGLLYLVFAVLAFTHRSKEAIMIYGGLFYLVPLLVFACVHVISNSIKELRSVDDDESAYTRNLSLIVAGVLAAINVVVYFILFLMTVKSGDYTFLIALFSSAILTFTFTSQFMWGGVVRKIFTAGGFTFKLPGFIITLSLDSILWMIVVKFLLGIIAALVFIVTTLLVAFIAVVVSMFTFVPCLLMKTNKDRKARATLTE